MSQFLTDINLFNHEIKNFKIDTLTEVPGTLLAGRVVYVGGKYYGGITDNVAKTFAFTSDIPNIGTLTIQKDGSLVDTWQANADGTINITDVASKEALEIVQGYFDNGSAKTTLKLKTAVNLWGNSFDGSKSIGGTITFDLPENPSTGAVKPYFEIDKDGNIHTNAGFYSDKFISARGKDDTAGSGGGTSLDLVWKSLRNDDVDTNEDIAFYKEYKIAKLHLPTLEISDINLLTDQLNALTAGITDIKSKIPTTASETNKLADQSWVTDQINSSVSTNTAAFRGTYETVANLPSKTTITDLKNNDYAFVIVADDDGNPEYHRYKYTGATDNNGWEYEYTLNNSSFTATQWSAINSEITKDLVTKLKGIATGAQVNTIETIKVGSKSYTGDSSKIVSIPIATGSTAGTISIAGQDVAVKGWANFLTSIVAGNGISVSSNTVSVKIDSASESYLTVGKDGLKLSGINTAISTAVSNADKTSIKCQEETLTAGTSKAITLISTYKIKTIKTYLNGIECFCSILLDSTAANKATVSWSGVTLSTTNKLVIKTFYTTS